MKLVIQKPKFDIWTLIMSAYLINQFYFSAGVSIQRIFLLGVLAIYDFKHIPYITNLLVDTKKKRVFQIGVMAFFLWFLVVIATPFISGSRDYTYISYCITFFSWFMYLFAIVIRLKKKNRGKNLLELFMQLFIICMVLYVLSTIVILLVSELRTLVLSTVDISAHQIALLQRDKYYTRIGWAGFSGYSTSLKCTVAICFQLYFIVKNINEKRKNTIGSYVSYVLLMVGNALYARTGMLISLVCTIVAVFSIAIILNKTTAFIKYFVLVILLGIIGILALNAYSGDNAVLDWILEVFVNYESGNGLNSISTSIIFNQMIFEIKPITLLLGDGYYTSATGGYYMSTDLGFMRLILYLGLPATILIYWVYMYSLKWISTISKQRSLKVLVMALFITFLGFEFKGESIVILIPLMFIILLIVESPGGNKKEYGV